VRPNGKIGEITREAISGVDRCLGPDVGCVHGDPRSEIKDNRAMRAILMFLALGFVLFAARAVMFADCVASNC
jgi:hypothetical protein